MLTMKYPSAQSKVSIALSWWRNQSPIAISQVIFVAHLVIYVVDVCLEVLIHSLYLWNEYVMHSPMHDERNENSALCVGMNLSGLLQRQEMLDSCTEKTVILTGIVGDSKFVLKVLTCVPHQESQMTHKSYLTTHYFTVMHARTYEI